MEDMLLYIEVIAITLAGGIALLALLFAAIGWLSE